MLEIKFEDHDFPPSIGTLDEPKLLLKDAHQSLAAMQCPAALQLHHAELGHLTPRAFVSVWSEADATLQQGVPQGGEGVLLAHRMFLHDLRRDTQNRNIRANILLTFGGLHTHIWQGCRGCVSVSRSSVMTLVVV